MEAVGHVLVVHRGDGRVALRQEMFRLLHRAVCHAFDRVVQSTRQAWDREGMTVHACATLSQESGFSRSADNAGGSQPPVSNKDIAGARCTLHILLREKG